MKKFTYPILSFLFLLTLLVSCGKNTKSPAGQTASPISRETFLNNKFIEVLCESNDNALFDSKLEVYIASPQDNISQKSAYGSSFSISTNQEIDSNLVESIHLVELNHQRTYTSGTYSLIIDLLETTPPYHVKGEVTYDSDTGPVTRELSCLIETLD